MDGIFFTLGPDRLGACGGSLGTQLLRLLGTLDMIWISIFLKHMDLIQVIFKISQNYVLAWSFVSMLTFCLVFLLQATTLGIWFKPVSKSAPVDTFHWVRFWWTKPVVGPISLRSSTMQMQQMQSQMPVVVMSYAEAPLEPFYWVRFLRDKTSRWATWLKTELQLFLQQFPTGSDLNVWHVRYRTLLDDPTQYPDVSYWFPQKFPRVENAALRDALGVHCSDFFEGDRHTQKGTCGRLLQGFVAWHAMERHQNPSMRHNYVVWTMERVWLTAQVKWQQFSNLSLVVLFGTWPSLKNRNPCSETIEVRCFVWGIAQDSWRQCLLQLHPWSPARQDSQHGEFCFSGAASPQRNHLRAYQPDPGWPEWRGWQEWFGLFTPSASSWLLCVKITTYDECLAGKASSIRPHVQLQDSKALIDDATVAGYRQPAFWCNVTKSRNWQSLELGTSSLWTIQLD